MKPKSIDSATQLTFTLGTNLCLLLLYPPDMKSSLILIIITACLTDVFPLKLNLEKLDRHALLQHNLFGLVSHYAFFPAKDIIPPLWNHSIFDTECNFVS